LDLNIPMVAPYRRPQVSSLQPLEPYSSCSDFSKYTESIKKLGQYWVWAQSRKYALALYLCNWCTESDFSMCINISSIPNLLLFFKFAILVLIQRTDYSQLCVGICAHFHSIENQQIRTISNLHACR